MSFVDTLKQKLTDPAPADKYVLWVVMALSAMGVVAVYSAITFLAEVRAEATTERFLLRHLVRAGLALGAVGLFSVIDYRTVVRFSRIALIVALGLLLAVQIVRLAFVTSVTCSPVRL